MSSGCNAGRKMTCVTDLKCKQRILKTIVGDGDACCVTVIPPRPCCTLFGPPCAGVPAASPDPPSAASGGRAVSGAPALSLAVPPARHAGSQPPAAAQRADSPGCASHCDTPRS